MRPPRSFLPFLSFLSVFLLLVCAPSANSAVSNTTIDDTSSAFVFTGEWTAVSDSQPCEFCSSQPDPSQTFGGTWHDGNCRTGATDTTTGSFTFTGSAVFIYGIDQAQSQPNIVFTLGGTQTTHHYTGTERFAYNALFFSATGLEAGQTHTVNWIFNVDSDTDVVVQSALFDYAIVTSGTDDVPTSVTTPSTNPNPTLATNQKEPTTISTSTAPLRSRIFYSHNRTCVRPVVHLS
ncbi:hypothetical protein GGX14DRAFT_162809 [Mycena pura]|uniref:Uncharacterized protein n=1 Tax=Mycena pura TaxID=153505 RepID=A0AAD7E1Z6_9AGAR|nr:hypothetical protein GGX14DRAFT_162809 [Mycena pura]